MTEYRIGIDVGGTFTDFLFLDEGGDHVIRKSPTTPSDLSEGVFSGLGQFADDKGMTLEKLLNNTRMIVHGTTITTNAVLTGTGAKIGFVVTDGFRDILNMRRGLSDKRYDWKTSPPPPLVPRRLIATVRERVDVEGQQLGPLNEEDVRAAARLFRDKGLEAIGISYLWSFLRPEHERRTAEILQEELGDLYFSLSSEVLPQIRLYERNSTTALNAYVGPPLARYLARLQARLEDHRFKGNLLIMQSNGGVMSPQVAAQFAVNTLLSGPAAAPVAAVHYGAGHDYKNLISVDMGGTSFDVAMIHEGVPTTTRESSVRGYQVAVPMLDIHTIGAGGGSVAWVDAGGILQVGPQSAGADPGPVCYGHGCADPTVTDACLTLGYLDPETFAGGTMQLDDAAARETIREKIAVPLGLDVIEAAHGIYRIVNARMADAVNLMSIQRGDDPRRFVMVVAGGAGPMHAASISKEIGIATALIPRESSVFCAAGMLLTDLKHAFVRTYSVELDTLDFENITRVLDELRKDARATLESEGVGHNEVESSFSADLRYVGQFNEVEVPAFRDGQVSDSTVAEMSAAFHVKHDLLFGYSMPDASVELINVHHIVTMRTAKPALTERTMSDGDPQHARINSRSAFFSGAFRQVDVYDGLQLVPGNRVPGPAIVEQPTTTAVVPEHCELYCDQFGNFVMRIGGS